MVVFSSMKLCNLDKRMLCLNLYSRFLTHGSGDYGRGGNQPNLNMDIVKNFEITISPIEDQNKFAKIVEKVEAQKQKNELVIEQMNNLFNSLSQRAFKGEI